MWTSTCPRRHPEQHILLRCGHMPVQWNVYNLLRALLKTLLPYATTLSATRKCKMWTRKNHIPPGLMSITHLAVVLRLLCRLLRSAHLNHTAPLRHRWAMPWQLPTFGHVHSPHVLPGLRPPLSSSSHVLPQCCNIHLGGLHIMWRARLALAAPIHGPHHLRTRGTLHCLGRSLFFIANHT